MSPGKPHAARTILLAGLLSGALDLTAAFVTWVPQGVAPTRLLQGIASGLLGAASFRGGWETAALGAACHFFIALSAAAVFYAASRKLPFLTRDAVLAGALYGIAVYLVMYWGVLPLSRCRLMPFSWATAAVAIVTHILCVGVPISLVVGHDARKADTPHSQP